MLRQRYKLEIHKKKAWIFGCMWCPVLVNSNNTKKTGRTSTFVVILNNKYNSMHQSLKLIRLMILCISLCLQQNWHKNPPSTSAYAYQYGISLLRKCTLMRKCTHNNHVPEPRTVLRVHWKWPVNDIRQGQPLTNCKYKSKLPTAAEEKTFRARNKSKRIWLLTLIQKLVYMTIKLRDLNLLVRQAVASGAQKNIRLNSSLQHF